jgi:ferric-dicitrate binding protein FerR (iron transport regulator)
MYRKAPRSYRLRRALVIVAGFALFMLQLGGPLSAQQSAGSVTELKGEAFAKAGEARRMLASAEPILVGDHVGTGPASRLTMLLGRDTTVRLGERGGVVIDRFLMNAGGEITLQSGPMLFERPAGSAPQPFQIRSSYGLIAVRGTRFFAGPEGGALAVFVERGQVSVAAGGRQVVLRSGDGTAIPSPGAKPSTPTKWKEPRIVALFGDIR